MQTQSQDLFPDKDEESLPAAFEWWEKRRLLYNLIVGITGLFFLVLQGFNNFDLWSFIVIVFFGIAANVLYFTGFVMEACFRYYLKMTYSLAKRRIVFFWFGTGLSMLLIFCIHLVYSLVS